MAILFTDLVGFSDWALEAGDEAALEVLRQVGDAEQKAISSNKGAVVKRLGDGAMAVFSDAEQAVTAALEAQRRDLRRSRSRATARSSAPASTGARPAR